MNQDGKTGQGGRLKFLIQQPVTDDMLDIVSHHREHGADEVNAKILVMKRGKGNLVSRRILRVRGVLQIQSQLRDLEIMDQRLESAVTGRSKRSI